MSLVQIQGNAGGTGTLTVAAPSTNTNRTLTLPDGTGTFSVAGVNSNIVAGTAVASTSGTSIDFTGIPTWVKRITVMFVSVSTNGTSPPQIQLGYQSPVTTTGYLGANSLSSGVITTNANFTSGFGIGVSTAVWTAAAVVHGFVVLNLQNISTNTWTACGNIASSAGAAVFFTAGSIALGGALDRVRITTVNGTDTFDAGSINILYE